MARTDDAERDREISAFADGEHRIPQSLADGWLETTNSAVFARAWDAITDGWNRIDPIPDRVWYGRAALRHVEIAVDEPSDPFETPRINALLTLHAYLADCVKSAAEDQSAAAALEFIVPHIAAAFRRAGPNLRRQLVQSVLEHVFEDPRARSWFKVWTEDPDLREAYFDALEWAEPERAHGRVLWDGDIEAALEQIESDAPAAVWDAAKRFEDRLSSVTTRLLRLLSSPDAERASAAAYVLGFTRIATSREALEALLVNRVAPSRVKGQAAEALAHLDDPRSLPVLRNCLRDRTTDDEVVYWCLFAIGEIGTAEDAALLDEWASRAGGAASEGRDVPGEAKHAIARINARARTNV